MPALPLRFVGTLSSEHSRRAAMAAAGRAPQQISSDVRTVRFPEPRTPFRTEVIDLHAASSREQQFGRGSDEDAAGASSSGAPPRLTVIVVPGNPGCGAYYTTFAGSLGQRLSDAGVPCAVRCVSLAGHSIGFTADAVGLAGQIANLSALLEAHLEPGMPDVAILGHSIGSHIALHALLDLDRRGVLGRRRGQARLPSLAHVGLLMPFVSTTRSNPTQSRLRLLTRVPALFGALFRLMAWLPLWLQHRVLSALGLDVEAGETTARLIASGQAYRSAVLARDEFTSLDAEPDYRGFRKFQEVIAVYVAPEDDWATPPAVAALERELPRAVFVALPGDVVHGFCVSKQQSAVVADAVAARLVQSAAVLAQ